VSELIIRAARPEDAPSLCAIYNHYISETVITFEENPISEIEMQNRLSKYEQQNFPFLVAEVSGQLLGYAYASSWRERSAYRFAVETSVYLSTQHFGKGLGTKLYLSLFNELKTRGFKIAIGCITLPNEISIKLHENLGMRKVGHFEKVGLKFDQWLDVGFWQLEL
jgi:phosphinothricin acetyltransferase